MGWGVKSGSLALLLGMLALTACRPDAAASSPTKSKKTGRTATAAISIEGAYPVIKVTDGDTVELLIEGKKVKVRLIGVNTPETKHPDKPVEVYGPESSMFMRNLLLGESVYVEYDSQGAGVRDRYDRTLAFLYRAPDSLFVNYELVRQGYAKVYRAVEFRYRADFEAAEARAIEAKRGMWGQEDSIPPTERSAKGKKSRIKVRDEN